MLLPFLKYRLFFFTWYEYLITEIIIALVLYYNFNFLAMLKHSIIQNLDNVMLYPNIKNTSTIMSNYFIEQVEQHLLFQNL